jgi:hypothetical protein
VPGLGSSFFLHWEIRARIIPFNHSQKLNLFLQGGGYPCWNLRHFPQPQKPQGKAELNPLKDDIWFVFYSLKGTGRRTGVTSENLRLLMIWQDIKRICCKLDLCNGLSYSLDTSMIPLRNTRTNFKLFRNKFRCLSQRETYCLSLKQTCRLNELHIPLVKKAVFRIRSLWPSGYWFVIIIYPDPSVNKNKFRETLIFQFCVFVITCYLCRLMWMYLAKETSKKTWGKNLF